MLDPGFLEGSTWGAPGARVEHVETHAAHVFLVGDRAYKIKKSVKYPYLDFSTVGKREAVLARELEINRIFAPEIYLHVMHARGEPVLVMRRFRGEDLLAERLKREPLSPDLARSLARAIADAHRLAPQRDVAGSRVMRGLVNQLTQAFATSPDIFDGADAREFSDRAGAHLARLAALLDLRTSKGLVRRCHGDLHAGNIVVVGDRPMLFDCIEFSEEIATIDVLYDLAFLLMDLVHCGERHGANRVFNHYLNLRRREEDLSGLAAMPLFLAIRAGVRALVTADRMHTAESGGQDKAREEARSFLANCLTELQPLPPRLICVGGFSGSGKSTLADALAPSTGSLPGAVLVRSDVERKILAGVAETEKLPFDSYTPQSSRRVYDTALARAAQALKAGHAVILDAVFSRAEERAAAERLAADMGVAFTGLWLEATPAQMKARVAQRHHDASDADIGVIEKQMSFDTGKVSWHRVDAGGTPAEVLSRARILI
ncbi:MAG: AAA family ATPase [Rhizobiales bacterium]|nr:AAA family ATPase [Hyphomicrobiales bacterium]